MEEYVTFNLLDGFQLVEVKTGERDDDELVELYESVSQNVRTLKKTSLTICLIMMFNK